MTDDTIPAILKLLERSIQDLKFAPDEKLELRSMLMGLAESPQKLNQVRNLAFSVLKTFFNTNDSCGNPLQGLNWLEEVVKTIDVLRHLNQYTTDAFFSPGPDCQKKIISLSSRAQSSIDVCVFTITDDFISRALAEAHIRGIEMRIITDDSKALDPGSDIESLAKKGIAIRTDDSDSFMHHKFSLYDQQTLATGSFNWTRSASAFNQENLLVTTDKKMVDLYASHFEELWLKSLPFTA